MKLFLWLFVILSWTTRNAVQSYFSIDTWIQGYLKNSPKRSDLPDRPGRPDRPVHLRKCDIPTANRDSFFQILWVCLSNEKTE